MGRSLKSPVRVADLVSALGLPAAAAGGIIRAAAPVSGAGEDTLCFLKSDKYVDQVSRGAIVLTTAALADAVIGRGALPIPAANPRLEFARALAWLEQNAGFVWSDAAPEIDPTAQVGVNVALGRGVRIGPHTRILNNAVIGDEVVIGARCIVKSCAVIGEEGFGFERAEDGSAVRLPHLGGVIIEDDVEVGSLTTVCRGTLGDTVLKTGAKIDDHVHIAHNVMVGKHAFVIACAEVSGGVIVGDGAWIAPSASIKNQLRIGDRAVIGLGAVVLKDVAADQVIVGNPGKPLER